MSNKKHTEDFPGKWDRVGAVRPLPTRASSEFISQEEIMAILQGCNEILEEPHIDKAHTFLEEASMVMKQRAALRDKPEGERSMASIVATFNSLTGYALTEAEGWEFMILLKMVRGRQGNYNRDDYVDGAAYFGLLGECKSGEEK